MTGTDHPRKRILVPCAWRCIWSSSTKRIGSGFICRSSDVAMVCPWRDRAPFAVSVASGDVSEWSWQSHGRSVVNRSASTFPKRTEWRGLAAVGHVTSASSSTAVETSSRYPVRQPQTIRRSFVPVSLSTCAATLARLPDSSKHRS